MTITWITAANKFTPNSILVWDETPWRLGDVYWRFRSSGRRQREKLHL